MSDEKPIEYFVEFSIRIKERGNSSSSYGVEVFTQRVAWDYYQANPSMIPRVIAVINNLEVPNV